MPHGVADAVGGAAEGGAAGEAAALGLSLPQTIPSQPTDESGIVRTMQTTIDAAGRLVIPKKIREQAGLAPGMTLDVRLRHGVIEIEPGHLPVKLVREGRWLVAVPLIDVPPMTNEMVEQTLKDIEGERFPLE